MRPVVRVALRPAAPPAARRTATQAPCIARWQGSYCQGKPWAVPTLDRVLQRRAVQRGARLPTKCGVQGPPRLLNHSRFPAFRKYRRSVRYRAQPLYLLTPAGRFALRATAHRADASLRRAHDFAALANIGVLRVGRAQPLYLLTPPGRFGPFGAKCPPGTRFFRRTCGSLCRLWRQQSTGLTLPSGAPKPYAAAFFASIASARRGAGNADLSNFRGFSTVCSAALCSVAPGHISRRPSIALERVISSAYSRSLPTGTPCAMRVTKTPMGLSRRAM